MRICEDYMGVKDGEDDLFHYCQDMVSRLLLSLVFDICESEGDAEGLRALRRVMICYFLAKKPERLDSKYVYPHRSRSRVISQPTNSEENGFACHNKSHRNTRRRIV